MLRYFKKYGRRLSCILLVLGMVSSLLVGAGTQIAYGDTVTWKPVPEIYSDSCILIDGDTGDVIFDHNSHDVKYPASITKICTAWITLANHQLSDKMTLKGEALQKLPEGYATMSPKDGEKISVEDMLYLLLMHSANDAGNGLAVFDSGSIAAYAEKMNEYAKMAGAEDTHFANPSGLFDEEHTTTAYDMAMIMKECIKYEDFVRISSDLSHTTKKTNKSGARQIYSHVQPLLPNSAYYIPEVFSGKTGFTTPSRYTMVTAAKKEDRTLICVVMNCASEDARCVTTKRLFDYGFAYKKVTPDLEDLLGLRPESEEEGLVQMMGHPNFHGRLLGADSFLIPVGADWSDLEVQVRAEKPEALEEGETPGGILVHYTFSHQGTELGTAQVIFTPDRQIDLSKDPEFQFSGWKLAWAGLLLLVFAFIVIRSINWKKKDKKEAPVTAIPVTSEEGAKEENDSQEIPCEVEKEGENQDVETGSLIQNLKDHLEESEEGQGKDPVKEIKAQIIAEETEEEDLAPEDLIKSGESKEDILAQLKELLKEEE